MSDDVVGVVVVIMSGFTSSCRVLLVTDIDLIGFGVTEFVPGVARPGVARPGVMGLVSGAPGATTFLAAGLGV